MTTAQYFSSSPLSLVGSTVLCHPWVHKLSTQTHHIASRHCGAPSSVEPASFKHSFLDSKGSLPRPFSTLICALVSF